MPTCDFTRFDFYAPLVRCLETQGPFYCTLSDWGSLTAYTRNKTLLPNLQYLLCDFGFPGWISGHTAFLSPSLVSIDVTPFGCETPLNIEDASTFFANISMYCPAVENLSLLPFSLEAWGQPDGFVSLPALPFHRYFGAMDSLRIFSTNMTIFEAVALATLGRLPHLDTLVIQQEEALFTCLIAPVVLPDDSFPALRKLQLPVLEVSEFRSIWSIRQFITKPNEVKVELIDPDLESNAGSLLNDICQQSPQISDLTVEFNARIQIVSPDTFWSLQQLSLRKLSIPRLYFVKLDATCKILAMACPLLHELHLPDFRVSMSDLRYFAQLSQLEHLRIYVNWESCRELNQSALPPLWVSRSFRRLEGSRAPYSLMEPMPIGKTVSYVLETCDNRLPSSPLA